MVNNRFVLYQVKREIKRYGTQWVFMRPTKNEFGEPDDPEDVVTVTGLYHEHAPHMSDTYRILISQTPANYRTEKMPQLLITYEDFVKYDGVRIKNGDFVINNGRKLVVTGVFNVQEWNMFIDISLEEVDDGKSTG